MRQFLKQRIEQALATSTVARFTRERVRGKTLVLAYHGVVPHGGDIVGERSLFVTQGAFAAQLDAMADLADIVPLDRLDDAADDRPRVAITFDDAYQGAVTAAVEELAKRSLPATIFVTPGRLNGHVFWWDALAGVAGGLEDVKRQHALAVLAGKDERVRAWAAESGAVANVSLPAYARSATTSELRTALSHDGLTFGSHSWSHANLAVLDAIELADELTRPLVWLEREFPGRTIRWLAYPYGLESAATRDAAARVGYKGALRIAGGWHSAHQVSPFARPRLNIPAGLSVAGLRGRLTGAIRA